MSQKLFASMFAGALALTVTVAAQNPPPPQTPPPQTPTAKTPTTRAPMTQAAVTVEGCLVREADVPGRKPNVAERAGIAEDYLLTSTKVVKGAAPATGGAPAKPGETPAQGLRGAMLMYEVQGIDDEELKKHVGHRVQIDGAFENVDRATATPERKTPADDLVELRGTAIRQVAGECPAK